MFTSVVWQLVHGQSGGMPWIHIDSTNAMFGIETPKGRTPLQGASLDVTSPRAKAPGLFC
jgi:hypothetical protein